jgi:hypothetical protein
MNLKILKIIVWGLIGFMGLTGLVAFFITVFNKEYFNTSFEIDSGLASNFGDFFGGFVGTMFAITSTLLIILTIIYQYIETAKNQTITNFFKMLDYHNENVRQLSVSSISKDRKGNETVKEGSQGRRAFVIFKIQLTALLRIVSKANEDFHLNLSKDDIADIAYLIFYYGIDDYSREFFIDSFQKYPESFSIVNRLLIEENNSTLNIGRTNETSLSSYYRNLYNAIKLVDNDKFLSKKEKTKLITILRAQLSNPELFVFFYNILSRFGLKWIKKDYVMRYKLFKNLPMKYFEDGYPRIKFPMKYEEDELN